MSSSLLLRQCPARHVRLIWMVLELEGKWPYNCYFVRCCFQDLFNIAHDIAIQFLSSFFDISFVNDHIVHPYSIINTWKKLRFISSDRLELHMFDNLSIAVHAFTRHILISLSVDETLLPRYVNLSTIFRELPLRVDMSSFFIKTVALRFVYIHNASCCPLQTTEEIRLG